jgi:hypothetical protein
VQFNQRNRGAIAQDSYRSSSLHFFTEVGSDKSIPYKPNLALKKAKQKNQNIPEKFRIVFNIFTGYSHKSTAFMS